MSAKKDWSSLRSRISGKWQVPLLAVSLALFAGTIYRTRPEIPPIPFVEALAKVDALLTETHFLDAIRFGRELGSRTDLTAVQRSQIELRLGRARFGALRTGPQPHTSVARQVANHFRAASPGLESPPLTADDFVSLGRLAQWQRDDQAVLEHFQRAIELGHTQADDLRKEIYLVHRDRLEGEPRALVGHLEDVLSKIAEHRLDVRIWCVEEMLDLAERLGDLNLGEALLKRESPLFDASDYRPQFEFLQCRLLVALGRTDEAEVRLRTLRNQVDPSSEVSGMSGWLLGTLLAAGESETKWKEALSFFTDVLEQRKKGPYAVASSIGQGGALAKLGRHDEAIAAYSAAVKQLSSLGDSRVVNFAALRGSLALTAELLRQKDDLGHAVEYATLAARLVETGTASEKTLFYQPLALLEEQWADRLLSGNEAGAAGHGERDSRADEASRSPEAIRLYTSAAMHFDELSHLNIQDEPRSADFSWKAAELFSKGGASDEAIRRYRAFVSERPEDHRNPTALIRVGQIQFARGQLAQAVETFEECHHLFPHSFDGARALVPLARTYLAMGRERFGEAERVLREVLEDSDVFTPEAGEFVESLFLLGDVLERDERYGPAITTLQEALDRYPGDPRVARGQFLLGGAYRKSALSIRAKSRESQAAVDLERAGEESVGRFRAARTVYRKLINELEYRAPSELDEQARMYLRYSYLYEADCYFETQEYADALKLYEQAAGNLRDSSRGLSAYVQMINCHVFLGNTREAKAALARALVVVNSMPDVAFANRVAPESRAEWKSYFEWLGQSELFW